MSHTYMPISVSLKKTRCLVVGGGKVALRKVDNLLDYDTVITVVAPEPHEKIQYYAEKGLLTLERREYRSPEAADYGLVISASDNKEVNQTVYEDGHKAGRLVNVVDNPPLCDFIFPALVRREHLTAAISTDGKAPFLAGHLKLVLENIFPDHWTKLVKKAAEFRKIVQKRWPDDFGKRQNCFDAFLSADWKTLLKEASDAEIDAELDKLASGDSPTLSDDV